jgi:hypothetical protein
MVDSPVNNLPSPAPNPTWTDVKQIGWTVLLVLPVIAVASFGASRLVGTRAAAWVGIGLAVLSVVTFALIVCSCLLLSFGGDALDRIRRRRARSS